MYGTLYGTYFGDYFGPITVTEPAVVAYARAWVEYPHGALDISHAYAILAIEAQVQAAKAIALPRVVAPQGAIDIAHGYAIVEVEAEPYEEP